jgi:hypothetical protein
MNPPSPPASDALVEPVDGKTEDAMRVRLKRLARRDRSGGWVIERATLLAGGIAFDGAGAWIQAHTPRAAATGTPLRFVLPADALD